jgi:hypothetical protein
MLQLLIFSSNYEGQLCFKAWNASFHILLVFKVSVEKSTYSDRLAFIGDLEPLVAFSILCFVYLTFYL